MKCDYCKHRTGNQNSMYLYFMEYCSIGHWEGGYLDEPIPKVDPWKDCKDFETNE